MQINRYTQPPQELEFTRPSSVNIGHILDMFSFGIVILSIDGNIIVTNEAAEHLLQKPLSKLVGKPFPLPFGPEGCREIELEVKGKKETLQVQSKVIDEQGATKGYLLEITSLTALKNAEATATRAQEASKLKSDFLAAMSHEIRNPMTGVIGMTSLLLETALNNDQQRYVQAIKSSGDLLLRVLNDVLDLSKIEAGKLNIEVKDFRLIDIIEDTLGLFSEPARRKELLLTNLIKPDVPRVLRGDPTRIRQVITNLVSNAVKFTTQGHVVVTALIEDTPEGYYLRIEVSDSGPGLAASEAQELFKPFQQIRRVMQGVPSGTGLGLALSKQLVEAMNGRIGVDSRHEQGSRFWFTIPISRACPTNPLPWDLSAKSVLIVTSSLTIGQLISEQLMATGARCNILTPNAALECLQETHPSFDVIIIDDQPEGTSRDKEKETLEFAKLSAEFNIPMLMLCNTAKPPKDKKINIETAQKSALCQSQLCRQVASLLGVKDSEGDANRRHALLAATKMKPISRHDGIPRLLVVEDDPINQAVMKMMLERLGFSIDVVTNGMDAIDAAIKNSYAAILMDYCLPGLDGISATAIIRRHEKAKGTHTPILGTTANATAGVSEKCLEAGMDGCLTKPFSIEILAESLQKHLESYTEKYVDEKAIRVLQSLSIMGEQDSFFAEMVDLFMRTTPPLFENLNTAILEHDSKSVQKIAHRLKGSAGHFGAKRLTECLDKLEHKGQEGDLNGTIELLEQVRSEYAQVLMVLNQQKPMIAS